MNALHQAVARALRQEMWVVKVAGLSDAEAEHLARTVVGVCLAEATRAIEATRDPLATAIYATIQGVNYEANERPECSAWASRDADALADAALGDVLAALAALVEDAA